MAASDAANDGRRVVRTGRTAAPGARERQAPAGRLRNAARKDDLEEEGSARKTVRFGTRRTREQLEECSNAARSVETPAAAAVRNRRDEAAAGRAAGAEAPAEFVLAQPPIIIGGSSVRAGRFTRLTASARRGRTEAAHAEAAQEEVEAVEETKFAAGAAGPNDTWRRRITIHRSGPSSPGSHWSTAPPFSAGPVNRRELHASQFIRQAVSNHS